MFRPKLYLKIDDVSTQKSNSSETETTTRKTVKPSNSHFDKTFIVSSNDSTASNTNACKANGKDSPNNRNQSLEESMLSEYKGVLKNLRVNLVKYKDIESKFNSTTIVNGASEEQKNGEQQTEMVRIHQRADGGDFEATRRYPKRNRKQRLNPNNCADSTKYGNEQKKPKHRNKTNEQDFMFDAMFSTYNWSDCKLAARYDKERNFFPEPGPSHENYYEDVYLDGYYRPVKKTPKKRTNSEWKADWYGKAAKMDGFDSPTQNSQGECDDANNDILMQSYYDQNSPNNDRTSPDIFVSPVEDPLAIDTPNENDPNATISTPVLSKFLKTVIETTSVGKKKANSTDECQIQMMDEPPSIEDVNDAIKTHEIPEVVHLKPFYGDPNDVISAAKKEVGQTVLRLGGKSTNDLEEFQPKYTNGNGLKQHNETVSCQQHTTIYTKIVPVIDPPSPEGVIQFVKSHSSTLRNDERRASPSTSARSATATITTNSIDDDDVIVIDADSPVKMRREKPNDVLEISDDEEVESTSISTTITTDSVQVLQKIFANENISLFAHSKSDNHKKAIKSMKDLNKAESNDDEIDTDDDVICLDDCQNNQFNIATTSMVGFAD